MWIGLAAGEHEAVLGLETKAAWAADAAAYCSLFSSSSTGVLTTRTGHRA